MPDSEGLTPAQRAIGDFAPKLVSLTDDVLFGDVWERTELPKRDRSLITVAARQRERLDGGRAHGSDDPSRVLRGLAAGDVGDRRRERRLQRLKDLSAPERGSPSRAYE
jgi:hypothetical protein